MAKKILVVLSEFGYWGEELVGPLDAIDGAGYETVFATPKGKRSQALPPSMDSKYVDPPLGRTVVSEEMAKKVVKLEQSSRLDKPLNLSELLPERPYLSVSSGTYIAALETYYQALEDAEKKTFTDYSALLLVGGSGPIVDMVNNQRVHDLILAFLKMDKPIAAECYGVACLAFARDIRRKKSIIWSKRVTGHPLEFDYKDGTGFLGTDFNMGPPPYPLEYILRDAVGPEGEYISNVGNRTSVIVDYPFITSRSTAESTLCGEKLIEVLDKGLRRFGW
jgi:putative intracellular protease/amidase